MAKLRKYLLAFFAMFLILAKCMNMLSDITKFNLQKTNQPTFEIIVDKTQSIIQSNFNYNYEYEWPWDWRTVSFEFSCHMLDVDTQQNFDSAWFTLRNFFKVGHEINILTIFIPVVSISNIAYQPNGEIEMTIKDQNNDFSIKLKFDYEDHVYSEFLKDYNNHKKSFLS